MSNKVPKKWRQGDVLIVEADTKPADKPLKQVASRVVAEGEVTGHMHTIAGQGLGVAELDTDGQIFLSLPKGGALTHQEHGTITLPAGNYTSRRQTEYDPVVNRRRVAD